MFSFNYKILKELINLDNTPSHEFTKKNKLSSAKDVFLNSIGIRCVEYGVLWGIILGDGAVGSICGVFVGLSLEIHILLMRSRGI